MKYNGIEIDVNYDNNLSEQAYSLLKDYYMLEGETTPQMSYARAALAFCYNDIELAQRIYEYAAKNWFMFSSPILSNAKTQDGKNSKGLPISCFLSYVDDSLEGLMEHSNELRWMSVKGGGVGGHWSSVRANSEISPGPIPFLKTVDADMTAYRQGKTRKGSYAAYIDVSHPDIVEFLNIRVPTGGDSHRKCFNLNNAINITDDFMNAVSENKEWQLIDPKTKKVRDTINARDLWQRILEVRFRTGEPYLNFIDEANRKLPEFQKNKGLKINGSNLCNEIHLATDNERSAVCCLSSLNLEKFEEWKNTTIVEDCITFLDNVLQYFIDHATDIGLKKARFSAMQERSLGLGAMGFHAYLQSKNIPWESALAKSQNMKIFALIKDRAVKQTTLLAKDRGEAPDAIGYGIRNAHLLAIAPNANSSIIAGTSPSIEPYKSNAYTHRTRAGAHLVKNHYLENLLNEKALKIEESNRQNWLNEIWTSIITNDGSVQHLDCLNEWEKNVFKTAFEIDQRWLIDHASDRQEFICQGQSVNLFFPAGTDKAIVNAVHLRAWKNKLKGLYYLRTNAGAKAETVSEKVRTEKLKDFKDTECLSCQG
jgi:ribonucleoside-diphosphate reductase alpha chain